MLEHEITDTCLDAVFSATENAVQPFFTPRIDILAIQYNLDELIYSRDWNGFLSYYNDQLIFLKTRRTTLITSLKKNLGITP